MQNNQYISKIKDYLRLRLLKKRLKLLILLKIKIIDTEEIRLEKAEEYQKTRLTNLK